ncbi:MAG TPA: class I SAM-dependent methyltransferase [Acidimicrobiales bacterium]|nr:class I SAM-dependent methyltransferase [Acidimicrobiales bacterium]
MGPAYLRYSFTKGTEQEVAFLVDALDLKPGTRVLDVGCGPGRHAYALAERGIEVVGVDISQRFVDLANESAPAGATFQRADARALAFDGEFDVAVSLCQGAFGLVGDEDGDVLRGMARAVKSGGRVAFSAFSAYFAVRFLEDQDTFDAATGVNHETTSVKDEAGTELAADLWTSCFTPRELGLLCTAAGLTVDHIYAVTPGAYAADPPDLEHPEFLMLATHA